MRVPQSLDEITAGWIEELLRDTGALGLSNTVRAVRNTVIGEERGFLSRTVRCEIDYAAADDRVPASVVIKLEPASSAFRDAERETNAFEREIRFYRAVSGRVPIRLPRLYAAEFGGAGHVLVLEDLSALECGDQIHGLRQAQVLATVREVAKLHAHFWRNEALDALDWMPVHNHFFEDGFEQNWPAFARSYELRIGRDALRLGERVATHLRWIEERMARGPHTVMHGDLRADNLLFGQGEVVILDWQLATRSVGAVDVARLLGGSEPPAERRGHQMEVFAGWHEELLRAGVADYSFEEALADFRLGVLHCLFIPVKAFALAGADAGGRTGRLLDAISERLFASALELEAGDLLP